MRSIMLWFIAGFTVTSLLRRTMVTPLANTTCPAKVRIAEATPLRDGKTNWAEYVNHMNLMNFGAVDETAAMVQHNLTIDQEYAEVAERPYVVVRQVSETNLSDANQESWRYVRLRGVRGMMNMANRIWLGMWHMLATLTGNRLESPSLKYIDRDVAEQLHRQLHIQCRLSAAAEAAAAAAEWECSTEGLHGVWEIIHPLFLCQLPMATDNCLVSYEVSIHQSSAWVFTFHFLCWAAVFGMTTGTILVLLLLSHLLVQPRNWRTTMPVFGMPLLAYVISSALLWNDMINIERRHTHPINPFLMSASLFTQVAALSQSFSFLRSVFLLNPFHIAEHQLHHKLFQLHNLRPM